MSPKLLLSIEWCLAQSEVSQSPRPSRFSAKAFRMRAAHPGEVGVHDSGAPLVPGQDDGGLEALTGFQVRAGRTRVRSACTMVVRPSRPARMTAG